MNPTPRSPRAAKAKLPKARVRYMDLDGSIYEDPIRDKDYPSTPVSVIPHRTPAEARAFCAFWRLGEGERVERVARHLANNYDISWSQLTEKWREPHRVVARAVVALFAKPAATRKGGRA